MQIRRSAVSLVLTPSPLPPHPPTGLTRQHLGLHVSVLLQRCHAVLHRLQLRLLLCQALAQVLQRTGSHRVLRAVGC